MAWKNVKGLARESVRKSARERAGPSDVGRGKDEAKEDRRRT
jgi:hypothetical protein